MSDVLKAVNKINAETMKYAPAVMQGVLAVEQAAAPDLPGVSKQQLVVNAILAGSQAAQNVPIPEVQGIAGLVNLFVGMFNAMGVFGHKKGEQK